jgi:hypothetical protein
MNPLKNDLHGAIAKISHCIKNDSALDKEEESI